MRRAVVLVAFLVSVFVAAVAPSGQTTDAQAACFGESGFCISNSAFLQYFNLRGRVRTFGYPISREFQFLGFRVQFFQGHIMQLQPDGRVQTMNLLQEGLMPATRINGSTFPGPDGGLIGETPKVGERDYADRIVDFTRRYAPNSWEGRPVRFFDTFIGTVDLATAFPGGGGNASLLPLLNLEIWGAVTSRPLADPSNPGFVYQRYQRSIMHYREECRCTERILLADWFRTVITGQGLPTDLAQEMAGTPYIYQYSPGAAGWLARPGELPGTDLTDAFTPELPGFPSPGPAPAPAGPATATPISGDALPTVQFNIDDRNRRVDFGQRLRVEIVATDDRGLDRIEFEGEIAENNNENSNDNVAAGSGFERRVFEDECEGRTICAVVFEIVPQTPGEFLLVARARDGARQTTETTIDVQVRRNQATPTPTPTPTPVPTAAASPCSPRPLVGVAAAPDGAGRLRVTVTAPTTAALSTNALQALRFGAATNALIDAGGQVGATGSFSVALPAGTTQTSFVVRRATPGLATTVPFEVVDACGAFPTLVGGGPAAF